MAKISEIMHPDYRALVTDWAKWRLTYQSGRMFINQYLTRYSKREEVTEFNDRKAMSYCPAFARAAVEDVKNSIYQRLADIKRIGGPESYGQAVAGEGGGVDLQGSSMTNFMGQAVLSELLPMKKVGIYVDMPKLSGETVADTYGQRPYLYLYTAENIRSWTQAVEGSERFYTNVLLKDLVQTFDTETKLPAAVKTRYRRIWLEKDGVHIQFYEPNNKPEGAEIHLPKMKRIPFICLELSESLMSNIADYQIALMNLHSSDMAFLFRANFPFYVEEYEPRAESSFTSSKGVNGEDIPTEADGSNAQEIKVGTVSGRKYAKGTNAPSFIYPPTEPIQASMKKQEQLKNEIRLLLNLTLGALEPKFASAESKQMDQGSLESGLSAIGLTMEYGEREIAKIWAMYLGEEKPATVNYPEKYSLKSDADRRAEAEQYDKLSDSAPSLTFKKRIAKRIVSTLLDHYIDEDEMQKIESEIDAAKYIGGDSKDIKNDIEVGIVSKETASAARGYKDPANEVKVATEEHVQRLAEISKAQAASKPVQGNPDSNPTPGSNKDAAGNTMNPGAGRPPTGE